MSNIHDDVRTLETRVRELTNENRDLELENAQYRQRSLDAETERDKYKELADRRLRDATEASTILESMVSSFNTAMRRFRENHNQVPSPDLQVRPRFLAQVQEAAERTATEPERPAEPERPSREALAIANESEGSRMLRTQHRDLPRPPPPPPPESLQVTQFLDKLPPQPRTPAAVAPYVRPGSTRTDGGQ